MLSSKRHFRLTSFCCETRYTTAKTAKSAKGRRRKIFAFLAPLAVKAEFRNEYERMNNYNDCIQGEQTNDELSPNGGSSRSSA